MPKRVSFVGSGGGWRKPPASMPLKPPLSMPPTPHGPITTLPPPPKKGAGRKIKGAGIRKQQRGGSKKPMKGSGFLDEVWKPLKHVIPLGIGAVTGNPYLAAQGATGLIREYGGDEVGDAADTVTEGHFYNQRYGGPDTEPVGPSRHTTRQRPNRTVRRLGGPRRNRGKRLVPYTPPDFSASE